MKKSKKMYTPIDWDEKRLQPGLHEIDAVVFWKIWMQFKDELFRMCLKILGGSEEEAEDALSIAMLTALEKFPRNVSRIYNLKDWLIRLTRNICIDILRKQKCEVTYQKSMKTDAGFNKKNNNESLYFESTEDTWHREEILSTIYESIKKLPPRLKEPAILYFFLKISYRGIAQRFNLSDVNVRKRIQQARDILNREFKYPGDKRGFFLKEKRLQNSPTWQEIVSEAEEILTREFREINGSYTTTNMVRLFLSSGIEKSLRIFFKTGISRQETRIKTLREYVKRHPGGWKRRLELAELLYAAGHWDQAIVEFRLALQKHPQSLEAWIKLGDMLMAVEQEEKAVKTLKKALPFARKESSKFHIEGMIELCRSRVDRATAAFARAASLESTNEAHQQRLATSNLMADRPVEALEAFDRALEINPRDLYSLTYSYDCLVLTGRLHKAEQRVNKVLEIYRYDIPALKRKVDQHWFQGLTGRNEGKETRGLLRRMIKSAPQAADVLESQAIYRFCRGDYKKGLELLKHGTREKPRSIDHLYYYARWLFRTGSYQPAAETILKTLEMYKKSPPFLCTACEILAAAGRDKELKIIVDEMLSSFPGYWSICASAGLALAARGDEAHLAVEVSGRAVGLQPRLPEAYFLFGRVLSLAGKPDRAIETLLKGWQLLPNDDAGLQSTPAALLLARNYREVRDKELSLKWLEEVGRRAGKLKVFLPAEAYYGMGKALLDLGDIQGAILALGKAMDFQLFYPARQEAKSILKSFASKTKKQHEL